jgi:hypothetical protein
MAIILIVLAVRRAMTGGPVDYFSLGLALATLILAFIVSRHETGSDSDSDSDG